ncbi:MAG: acylphosphatase [Anaerolineae bacterium]
MTHEDGAGLHALITGRVQGVGFRDSTQRFAQAHALTGWVRNLPDGRVEIMAEGAHDDLQALIMFLEQGPPASRVDSVSVGWRAASHAFTHFEVTTFD